LNNAFITAVRELKSRQIILRDKDISDATGFSKGIVSTYLSGKAEPSKNFLREFAKVYNLNYAELLAGENLVFEEPPPSVWGEPATPYLAKRGIPFYEVDVFGGTVANFGDNDHGPSQYIDLMKYRGCNVSYLLKGNSMVPMINNGDLVLAKWVEDTTIINYGDVYLVVMAEMSVTKILRKGSGDNKLKLLSVNATEYDEFEIDKQHIIRLAKVKATLKDY
jgi:phage repressor protein C with HTH and peptisase S24 domain